MRLTKENIDATCDNLSESVNNIKSGEKDETDIVFEQALQDLRDSMKELIDGLSALSKKV